MKIPEYFARERMEPSRMPRAPAGIADVGAGIEAEAMTRFGGVLSRIAEKFQQAKDLTDATEADTNALKEFSRLENLYALDQDYGTIAERWGKDVDKLKAGILKKKGISGTARRIIGQRFDRDRVRFGASIQSLVRRKQISDGRAKYAEGLSIILKEGGELAEGKATALIVGTKAAGYITAEQAQADRENIPKMIEWYQIENFLYTNPAIVPEMIDVAEHLNPQEKNQLRSRARTAIATRAREAAVALEQQQERTGRQMLISLFDGKLTDVNEVTRAFAANLITETKAKALRKALLNPEPVETDLKTYAGVKKVINDIGRGTVNIDQALEVIYGSLDKLDPTTGKSLVDKIFGAHDKNDAEMLKEGRDLMEELIRDKDKWSGMFTDDERQILGTAEAILMFDSAIEKAAREKKELRGRDFLIEAIYIGRRIKNRITKEEEAETPPEFRFGGEAAMERRFETVSPDIEEMKRKHPEVWKAAQKVVEEAKEKKPSIKGMGEGAAKMKVRSLWTLYPPDVQRAIDDAVKMGFSYMEIIETKEVREVLEKRK